MRKSCTMGSTEKSTNIHEDEEEMQKASETPPTPTPISTSRPRQDSVSSDSTSSGSPDNLKRRRTAKLSSSPLSSFFFPSPLLPASLTSSQSPLSLDEVVSARNGVTNMALAHEIALDPNFQLEKFEPSGATVEKQVRDTMQLAFWDHLRDQLAQEPPVYTQAFVLLQEIREQLLEITLPHQQRLRQEISDKLDVDLITQQAAAGVLEFGQYSAYVVEMMGKLCAPVRDEAIAALGKQTDVVSVFCGVAETLDLMKLDMANYTIQMIRPTIVRQIVEYERQKFKEFMKTQDDGLELTRRWIIRNVDKLLTETCNTTTANSVTSDASTTAESNTTQNTTDSNTTHSTADGNQAAASSIEASADQSSAATTSSDALPSTVTDSPATSTATVTDSPAAPSATSATTSVTPSTVTFTATPARLLADPLGLRAFVSRVVTASYLELLTWPQCELLPEVMAVDTGRVLALRDRLCQLCLLASIQLVAMGQMAPRLSANSQERVKAGLKRGLCPLLDSAYTHAETEAAVPAVVSRAVECVCALLLQEGAAALTEEETQALRSQLAELSSPSHRITSLVTSRCLVLLSQLLEGKRASGVSVPQPFLLLQEEVARICKSFMTMTQHNRSVFGEFYHDMVEASLRQRVGAEGSQE